MKAFTAVLQLPLKTGRSSPGAIRRSCTAPVWSSMHQAPAGIPEKIKLSSYITDSVKRLKTEIMNEKNVSFDSRRRSSPQSVSHHEFSGSTCLEMLKELRGCDAHMTHMPTQAMTQPASPGHPFTRIPISHQNLFIG